MTAIRHALLLLSVVFALPGVALPPSEQLPERAREALAEYHDVLRIHYEERLQLIAAQNRDRERATRKLVANLKRAITRRMEATEQATAYHWILFHDPADADARAFFAALGVLDEVLAKLEPAPIAPPGVPAGPGGSPAPAGQDGASEPLILTAAVDLVFAHEASASLPISAGLPDEAFSASSCHPGSNAAMARADSALAWLAGINDGKQWLQVDFGQLRDLTGVGVYGRADGHDQWVSGYQLSVSLDGSTWRLLCDANGEPITFQGSTDRSTEQREAFPTTVVTRYLRVLPQTWNGHIALRCEFYAF